MALNPITFAEQVFDDCLYAQLRDLLQLELTLAPPLRKGAFVSLSRPFNQGTTLPR